MILYGSTFPYNENKQRKNFVIPPGLDKIYQEQLDKVEWSEDVRRRLYTLGALRRMFERRWVLEDLTAFLALVGIGLGLLLDQHMFRMMEWTGVYDYDPYVQTGDRRLKKPTQQILNTQVQRHYRTNISFSHYIRYDYCLGSYISDGKIESSNANFSGCVRSVRVFSSS